MKDPQRLARAVRLLFWGGLLRCFGESFPVTFITAQGEKFEIFRALHAVAILMILYGLLGLVVRADRLWIKAAFLPVLVAAVGDVTAVLLYVMGGASTSLETAVLVLSIVALPFFCLGMWAFTKRKELVGPPSSWLTSSALVAANFLVWGLFFGVMHLNGWTEVNASFGSGSGVSLSALGSKEPPVEVEGDPLLTSLGACGSMVLLVAAWIHLFVSLRRTQRAFQRAAV